MSNAWSVVAAPRRSRRICRGTADARPDGVPKPERSGRLRSGHRRGAVALELAIVSVVLLIFVFGIVEVGRLIMIQQIITNAAREGARFAVTPGKTDQQVLDAVDNYVTGSLRDVSVMPGYARSIEPLLADAEPHDRIAVTVQVSYSDLAWLNGLIGSPSLSHVARMRKEN